MSRVAKRFFYGAFYCALLAFIVVSAIPEKEVPPVSRVPEGIRALETRGSVTVMTATDGSMAFLARIRNPNATHLASEFPFSFRVMRGNVVVMETPRRNGFAYPLETTVLVETLSATTLTEDVEVALLVGEPTWSAAEFSLRPALTLVRADTTTDTIGVVMEGEVKNASAVTAATVRIVGIVKDVNGFPLFAAHTVLQDIPGGATRTFFIRFPRDRGISERVAPDGTEIVVEAKS